ncbi:MAG: hypothetical protein B6D41_22060 [Chloroflexi bacterium UTCFX4]|jgi:small-conductance mechanosensitive channel|nr:MAG: hypothetical protein B6D41_22060 [Chloroflexi bacterium UTCFX4]
MASHNLEDLRSDFDRHHQAGARSKIEQTFGFVIGAALEARQLHDGAKETRCIDLLVFWNENFPQYASLLSNKLEQLIQTTERQNAQVQQQIAGTREKITQLENAGQKRQQWIERLMLVKKIQDLEADPLWNQRARAHAAQHQVAELTTQLTARLDEIKTRAQTLMEQLNG